MEICISRLIRQAGYIGVHGLLYNITNFTDISTIRMVILLKNVQGAYCIQKIQNVKYM